MQIFADASLNDDKKIAGVGCVCVSSENENVTEQSSFFSASSIHIAELFALGYAVHFGLLSGKKSVRIVSDSAAALNKLHQYMECVTAKERLNKKQHIFMAKLEKSSIQKDILNRMVNAFMHSDIHFSFGYTHGHQKGAAFGTDGYWNEKADGAAAVGRIYGEHAKEKGFERKIEDSCKALCPIVAKEEVKNWGKNVQTFFVPYQPKKVKVKIEAHHKGRQRDCDSYHVRIDGAVKMRVIFKSR